LVEISELVQGFHGIGKSVRAKKNRRVAGGFWRFVAFSGAYAKVSLPPEALENQK
jgi:hypothetical protein